MQNLEEERQDLDMENASNETEEDMDNYEMYEIEGSDIDNLEDELPDFDPQVESNIPINNILSRAKDCYIEKWTLNRRYDYYYSIVLIDYKTERYRLQFALRAFEFPSGSNDSDYPNGGRYFRIEYIGWSLRIADNENIFDACRNLIHTRVQSNIEDWQNETGDDTEYVQNHIADYTDLQRDVIKQLDVLEAKFKTYGIKPFNTPKPLIVQQNNAGPLLIPVQDNQINLDSLWLKNPAEGFPWLQKFIYWLNKFFNKAFPSELSYEDFKSRISNLNNQPNSLTH